ncbi:MAG: ArnT family glycosyltransferase [Steroidobacteraceae bacterium]
MNPEFHRLTAPASGVLLRHPIVLISLLILGACVLVASTYRFFGITWDEPEHLAAGMQLLDRDVYTYDIQHPALARKAMALGPYLLGAHASDAPGPSGEQPGRELLYKSGHYELYLYLARLGMLPFLAVLLWSTWAWTRHFYGSGTALLATLMLIATPPILGHAGVAALDVPGAAMCTLAFYCLLRWFETQSWKYALATGLSSGLAMASKLSSLPFIGVVGLAWLLCWWFGRLRQTTTEHVPRVSLARWFAQTGTMLLAAVLCTAFTYSFDFRYTVTDQAPSNAAWNYLFGVSGWAHEASYAIARAIPLPVGLERLVLSIQALAEHNHEGHMSYLLGRFSQNGFRYFYIVALAVKTPIPLLLLGTAGLIVLMLKARLHGWLAAAPTVAFVVLLAFCSFYSHINIGVRHVFVLYPLLCMAAAVFTVDLWRRHHQRLLRGALALLLGWQVSLLWSEYPDYLPYFNFLAGDRPEHILIDSDLDWSQDVERLQRRLTELKITRFGFVYRGTIDVLGERLPGVWMVPPFQPATGWIASGMYARETVAQGEAYKWLKQYTPVERIGKSIDLYYIPEQKQGY